MPTFIAWIVLILLIPAVYSFFRFWLRVGRHIAKDVSNYSASAPPTLSASRKAHRGLSPAEKEYFAKHVPESARRK
jgi:hypothetical protein